jgi:hypothetical protein
MSADDTSTGIARNTAALAPLTIGQRLKRVAADAQPALDRLDAIVAAKSSTVPKCRRPRDSVEN